MKLRLRSLESKETLKIEVPNSCSLQQLKDTVSRAISSSSSSSLHLSLNRKDEINASSPDETLQSIGIAGGDLIFYTLNPNTFSLETLPHKPTPQDETDSRDKPTNQGSTEMVVTDDPSLPAVEKSQTLDAVEAETMDIIDGSDEAVVERSPTNQGSPEMIVTDDPSFLAAEKSPTLDAPDAETIDMIDGSDEAVVRRSTSEPSFVKRVLREALGNESTDLKLLVFAVHAVILESGFVRVDQVSGMAVSCSHLLDDWPSASSSTISLRYTLPDILTNGASQTVNLKFQTLGHLVNVCGSLSDDSGSRLHRVCIDKSKCARPLMLMLGSSESNADCGSNQFGKEVFELWKMVKDRLALPLLIDLCEKAGFDLPPCFMRLPMELKLMILEYLPGVDLAKVACTCSELRYLSSNNELWKKKFEQEFAAAGSRTKFFKDLFVLYWETRKKAERQPFKGRSIMMRMLRNLPRRRSPYAIGIPPFWGAEYDLQPHGSIPAYPRRRSFIPPCHLGGFNN